MSGPRAKLAIAGQAPADTRRRRRRVRAPGLPRVPRLRHRRRGGVAYGLVYHYFASKDEVLDTLFLERWNVMLELIREVDAQQIPVREKLARSRRSSSTATGTTPT